MEGKEYAAIEELKDRKATPDAIFQGAKALNGWKPGKMVTEQEYDSAVENFKKAPADGRKQEVETGCSVK